MNKNAGHVHKKNPGHCLMPPGTNRIGQRGGRGQEEVVESARERPPPAARRRSPTSAVPLYRRRSPTSRSCLGLGEPVTELGGGVRWGEEGAEPASKKRTWWLAGAGDAAAGNLRSLSGGEGRAREPPPISCAVTMQYAHRVSGRFRAPSLGITQREKVRARARLGICWLFPRHDSKPIQTVELALFLANSNSMPRFGASKRSVIFFLHF
jgi:hypothetical protein